MTRIRANCPGCGEVELTPPDVTLRLTRSTDALVGDGSTYRFLCPGCCEMVSKPADERVAQLLSNGGVPIEEPADLDRMLASLLPSHPEAPVEGPRLTADDLLELHQLLDGDDWFERLLSG